MCHAIRGKLLSSQIFDLNAISPGRQTPFWPEIPVTIAVFICVVIRHKYPASGRAIGSERLCRRSLRQMQLEAPVLLEAKGIGFTAIIFVSPKRAGLGKIITALLLASELARRHLSLRSMQTAII